MISSHCQSDFDSLVEVCDAWLNKMKEEKMLQAVISALEEVDAKDLAEELNFN